MKNLIMFGLSIILALCGIAPASAQGQVISRIDSYRGSSPSYTNAIIYPEFEVWLFTFPTQPDIEVGRLWPVYQKDGLSLSAGGYGVWWPESQDWFIMPSIYALYEKGRWQASTDLMYYWPLTGGPSILFTDEAWVGYRVDKRLRIGLTGSFFLTEWGSLSAGIGPGVKLDIDKRTTLGVRYLFGVEGSDSIRVQINRSF